ncbi:MAG TPA: ABC transporter permease [Micromonosporaceae bacterium]|jgi:simple sugar transport system permease protein
MSGESTVVAPPAQRASVASLVSGRRARLAWTLIAVAAGLLVFSAVRVITGAQDLTSAGAFGAMLTAAVPIGLAGLGGLWSERSGVVNIGLEGMMILGTWGGAWGAITFGVWGGVIVGALAGAVGGLLHALATVTFNVDHIVSGVAITILGTGAARYLSSFTFAKMPGGGVTQSPYLAQLPRFSLPGVDHLDGLERRHWFLISDLGGIVRGLLTNVSALTVIAILLVPATYYVLWRTPFGLRLRSCGENPRAAESLGVNVYLYKYLGVVISGGLAGLGGAFLSMVGSSIYREGQTAGRGYIGLATMIFGNWRPGGLAAGAALFGYTDALQLRGGSDSVHGLLLFITIALAAIAVYQLVRGNRAVGIASLVIAALAAIWFGTTRQLPIPFVQAMPYVVTLVVLALASQRLRMPAADGQPYRKGGD